MAVCDECREEVNGWLDAVQDLAASYICKPKDREGRYNTKTTPFVPGQRGRNATAIVRAQIKLIETACAREHQGRRYGD